MKETAKTSGAPAAIGPYNKAVEINRTLYTSGQLSVNPETGK
jgi:2-iminobutanoate/2-iminopropanoate deaminase